MLSFFGDAAIKAKFIARMQAHIAADELVQGTGFEAGRGCSIGCTFDDYSHENYPKFLGLPEALARLNDVIFEGLPKASAQKFALDFLRAVPIGVDCSSVLVTTAIARHERALTRLADNKKPYAAQCRAAIQGVIAWLKSGLPDGSAAESAARSAARSAWSAAESAARSTKSAAESAARSAAESAESAAWSAAWSAAESVARSGAWSAWSGAESAARSGAWSAAWSAARSAAYSQYEIEAKTLLANLSLLEKVAA